MFALYLTGKIIFPQIHLTKKILTNHLHKVCMFHFFFFVRKIHLKCMGKLMLFNLNRIATDSEVAHNQVK